jgi:hypothetical protein
MYLIKHPGEKHDTEFILMGILTFQFERDSSRDWMRFKIKWLGVFVSYNLMYFPLYIVACSIVISTHKTKTLARNQAQLPSNFLAIEGIDEVEEELPPPLVAFSSPEDPGATVRRTEVARNNRCHR